MENFNIQEELKKMRSFMSEKQSVLKTVSDSIFRAAGIREPR